MLAGILIIGIGIGTSLTSNTSGSQGNIASSEQRANELRDRFASWYYVISSASFDKVRLSRNDLVKDKPADS